MISIKKNIKEFLRGLSYYYYKLKSFIYFYLYGINDLAGLIERMPTFFLPKILKDFGATIGNNVTIDSGIVIHRLSSFKDFSKIKIGNNTHLGHKMLLDVTNNIVIGDDCAFGANCQIWTHTGNWTKDRTDEADKVSPVLIGQAVICYSNVLIGQGVKIGDFARVGAGSVVLKNVENKAFYIGCPAKFKKKRDDI